MGCCGKARQNLSISRAALAAAQNPVSKDSRQPAGAMPSPLAPGSGPVTLRYLGQSAISVHGPSTGQAYAFSAKEQVRTIDRRDAAMLLRTPYFRQA
jgi:hypothetical protein